MCHIFLKKIDQIQPKSLWRRASNPGSVAKSEKPWSGEEVGCRRHNNIFSLFLLENQGFYPLVMTNIAMENNPFIDDFPSYKPPFSSGIFHGYVSHNQMVNMFKLRPWEIKVGMYSPTILFFINL